MGVDISLKVLEVAAKGAVPPVLAEFWRIVGGISLVDLDDYEHVNFWRTRGIRGPTGVCDGVHVDALDTDCAWRALYSDGTCFLDLAPDSYHKDNISGGNSYGVRIGDGWLAPWRNFDWTGAQRPLSAPSTPCDLLGYLRTAILECAGFPALFGVPAFEPVRERLLSGVLGF